MSINKVLYVLIGLCVVVSGCQSSSAVNALEGTPAATLVALTPTVMPLLSITEEQTKPTRFGVSLTDNLEPNATATLRAANDSPATPSLEPHPSPILRSAATPTATFYHQPTEYLEVVIFDDQVDPNWSLKESSDVAYDAFDTTLWFSKLNDHLDSGAVSLSVSPLADYSTLFFTVRSSSAIAFQREKALGISLWINSGSAILDTDDLVLTVVGSNKFSHWSPDDYSAFPETDGSFSETRLYYLGLNRALPPDTWVQVIVWLDDLLYDPMYSYITGFYIKNGAGFKSTFYVDNVTLLMMP